MKRPMLRSNTALVTNIGNALLFQALWFAAVLGAAAGWQWPPLLALLALLGWSACRRLDWRRDLQVLGCGVIVGMTFEVLWLGISGLQYQLMALDGLPPLWILCLWGAFAQTLLHSMAWMVKRPLMAVLFAGFGSVGSLYAGLRLGAASFDGDLPVLLASYGLCWAVTTPLLLMLAAERGALTREPAS